MRKKLLSLLTVLCLVLGMLPATALAAEYADLAAELGYSEEEVALYISEDTELTEDVEGLVLVVAPVTVTVKGAKLTTGLVVVPDAEGAVVTLGENADVNAVIVMAKAEVVVEETAVAASVTVTAAEASVTVAGTVETVTVAEDAEGTTVTVAETAKVETVKVAAPSVKVAVAGTVETVDVAETATDAELVVEETAAITEVTDATGALTVSGDGAENVTVTDTSAEPDEDEEKKDEEKDDEETKDDTNTDNYNPPSTTQPTTRPNDAKLVVAPQVDHPEAKDPVSSAAPLTGLSTGYDVSSKLVEGTTNTYDVVIYAKNVVKHTNANGAEGYWVGFGIPIQTGDGAPTYTYYAVTSTSDASTVDWSQKSPITSIAERTYTVGDTTYNTVYFDADGLEGAAMKVQASNGVEYLFNITFDVTTVPPTEDPTNLEEGSAFEDLEIVETEEPDSETEEPEVEENNTEEPESLVETENETPEETVDPAE